MTVLQVWAGYVIEVRAQTFVAILDRVMVGEGGSDIEATIITSFLPPKERHRLKVGAYFTWTIGIARSKRGIRKTNRLRFLRQGEVGGMKRKTSKAVPLL